MKLTSASNRIEYNHHILYNDIKYIREETFWVDRELKEKLWKKLLLNTLIV